MQVGDDAKFTCLVPVSETLPNFRWLKWNKSVNSIPKAYNEILNGSYRLVDPYYYKTVQVKSDYGVEVNIVNVTEDDFGLYTRLSLLVFNSKSPSFAALSPEIAS